MEDVSITFVFGHDDYRAKLASEALCIRKRRFMGEKQACGTQVECYEVEFSAYGGGKVFDDLREALVFISINGACYRCNDLYWGTDFRASINIYVLRHGSVVPKALLVRSLTYIVDLVCLFHAYGHGVRSVEC